MDLAESVYNYINSTQTALLQNGHVCEGVYKVMRLPHPKRLSHVRDA